MLEDAEDLACWFVALGRTVGKSWSDEVVAAIAAQQMEGFF